MRSAAAITLDYRPSRRVAGLALLGAVLACGAVLLADLAPFLRLACLAAVVAGSAAGLHGFLRAPVRRIAWRESQWLLTGRDGVERAASLRSCRRLGSLLVLGFRDGDRRMFHAVLWRDNIDAESRRRLLLTLARGEVLHAA